MGIPSDLKYTSDHEWLRIEDAYATVGITAFASEALGDVVYLELPKVGDRLTKGQACGEVESTKSVSDIVAPADGTVVEVNDALAGSAALVNSDPYGQGWLFRLEVVGSLELLDAAGYAAIVGTEDPQ